MGQSQSAPAPPPPSTLQSTPVPQSFTAESVIRIIVAGVSGSGKSSIIDLLKMRIASMNNKKEFFEVSEANEVAQDVVNSYHIPNGSPTVFTAMIFVVDLSNESSLMALSHISKRFRDAVPTTNLLQFIIANKSDLPEDSRQLRLMQLVDLADNDPFFKNIQIVKCIATTGVGIDKISSEILSWQRTRKTAEQWLDELESKTEVLEESAVRFTSKAK